MNPNLFMFPSRIKELVNRITGYEYTLALIGLEQITKFTDMVVQEVIRADPWQPIETAPNEREILIGRWKDTGFVFCQSGYYYDPGNPVEGEPPYWFWHCDNDTEGVSDDPQYWAELPPFPPKPKEIK